MAVQAPPFDYERAKLVLGHEVFEISYEAKYCLLIASQRSKILAVLSGKNVKERMH
jgi:hypothetical protein